MERLRALVYGTVLLLCIGWVLHVGKAIFVPAVHFGLETEPTWATLRQELLARIDLQRPVLLSSNGRL